MKRHIGILLLCVLPGGLWGCRKPAAVSNNPPAVAQQPEPQPSVCAAENVSRATLLRAKQKPAPTPR